MNYGEKVIGYCRVSTAMQAESDLGLQVQRRMIEAECERHGWELIGIEQDVQSGKSTTRRPGLDRVLAACRRCDAAGVVAAHVDRLSRSLLDFSTMVAAAEREGWTIVCADQGFDLSTPHGRMMASMLATFAEYERDLISTRVKDAMALAKKRGPKPGKKAIGRPRMVSDEVRKRIKRERRRGRSLAQIAAGLQTDQVPTAHGGARWHASTVRSVLAG
jgi:DNA invertase Pin-like site-specific DNA recombinase